MILKSDFPVRIYIFSPVMWCWRRLLRIPWTARRSNQSILKEISPKYSWKDWCWSWNSNTLATWCKEPTHWKRPWCWERLKTGGERDDRGWDGWLTLPIQWIWVWANSGDGEGQGRLACFSPWGCKELDTTEWLNNVEPLDESIWYVFLEHQFN